MAVEVRHALEALPGIISASVSRDYGGRVLEGFVVDDSEQYTIGSTNPLLNQQIPSAPNPDRTLSTLRSVRMTEPVDCAWLLENQANLFPAE